MKRLEEFTRQIIAGVSGLSEIAKAKQQEAVAQAEKISPEHAKMMKENMEKADIIGQVSEIIKNIDLIKSHMGGK